MYSLKTMNDYSKILAEGYGQFILELGGKKAATPYRLNIPYQPDRSKYGKSDPQTLIADTIKAAREKTFDLDKASVEEIRLFMEESWLGIDCSGFVYHLLDYLLKKIGKGSMEAAGFSKASRTNVELLTSDEFSHTINGFGLAQPGDLISLNSAQTIPHVLIIINVADNILTYAHSSNRTKIRGVHQGKIIDSQLDEELQVYSYNTHQGDGIRRLKALI